MQWNLALPILDPHFFFRNPQKNDELRFRCSIHEATSQNRSGIWTQAAIYLFAPLKYVIFSVFMFMEAECLLRPDVMLADWLQHSQVERSKCLADIMQSHSLASVMQFYYSWPYVSTEKTKHMLVSRYQNANASFKYAGKIEVYGSDSNAIEFELWGNGIKIESG
jgi:hypothetical protein